jgi:5-formyltetrahydrofolate cyclo-ligase
MTYQLLDDIWLSLGAERVRNPMGADDKARLRAELSRARRALTAHQRQRAARDLAEQALALPEVAGARSVAGYVSVGSEPGTSDLLEALRARGTRVLLPILLPGNDLDWGPYEGPAALCRAGRGLFEPPASAGLGPDAVTEVDAVLLPGLAVDGAGWRLGRGGGSYDRVLARLAAAGRAPSLVVLLYAAEVLESVPREAHDRPVDAVVTPLGVRRFGAPARRPG